METPPWRASGLERSRTVVVPDEPLKIRLPYYDNAKAVAVTFVVTLHTMLAFCLPSLPQHDSLLGVALVMSFIVMPALCFVSGHLSSASMTPARQNNLLQGWAAVIVLQSLFSLLLVARGAPFLPLWSTVSPLWYLFAILLWRTALPVVAGRFRWPVATAVALGVLAQTTDLVRHFFLITCTSFLPYFVAGYCTPLRTLRRLRRPSVQIPFLVFLVSLCALVGVAEFSLPKATSDAALFVGFCFITLYGLEESEQSPAQPPAWAVVPAYCMFLLISVPLVAGFLSIIPERKVRGITAIGRMSAYVYLLHPWAIAAALLAALCTQAALGHSGRDPHAALRDGVFRGAWAMPVTILLALSITACLAQRWVRSVCWPCVEPPVWRILRDPSHCGDSELQGRPAHDHRHGGDHRDGHDAGHARGPGADAGAGRVLAGRADVV